jgi:hypothetical protein
MNSPILEVGVQPGTPCSDQQSYQESYGRGAWFGRLLSGPCHFGFPVDEIRQLSNDGKNGTSRVNDKLKGPRGPGLDAEMGRLSDTEH